MRKLRSTHEQGPALLSCRIYSDAPRTSALPEGEYLRPTVDFAAEDTGRPQAGRHRKSASVRRPWPLLPLFVCVAWAALAAQEATAPPVLKQNPADAIRQFQSGADEPYELGKGDEISLDVPGHPELSSKFVVGPDGRITLPLAGSVLVADKTREQAAAEIEKALGKYYSPISVTVAVDRYTSNHVLLLGAVEHPGVIDFTQPPTLLQVISRGGLVAQPNKAVEVPDRCAIYRGADQVLWVDLKALLDSGNPLADIRLKRDDIVYVPSQRERFVSVMGEVLHPGAVPITSSSNLTRVLEDAGGVKDTAGRSPQIQVIQPSTGRTTVVPYQSLLQARQSDLVLHPGDVVFVPKSGFNRVSYVLDKMSPLITLFAATAFIVF